MNLITPNFRFPVPEEMKPYPNWICWGLPGAVGDEAKVPWSPMTGKKADPVSAPTWAPYEVACEYAEKYKFQGIGFVFSTHDPYAGIDLDDAGGDAAIIQAQQDVFRNFPSYAEISPSGRGLHIIVKGDVPRGRKRNKIEVYSKCRYFTMTGNTYRNVNILSCQEELTRLYKTLGGDDRAVHILDEYHPEEATDEEVYNRALRAANGEKFRMLWEGYWETLYPTQSEADYALIDILAFYTKSKPQIVRLFGYSSLGQRPKAMRRDYLDWMLNNCFDRILPPVDLSYLQEEVRLRLSEINLECENIELTEEKDLTDIYAPPPGLLGEIAQYIVDQAPRPVQEIALAASLGIMSGIVGRAYNVSNSGLNQYYLLLAPTGTGKEAMADGSAKLFAAVRTLYPGAMEFIGPGEIASSQGLIKYLHNESKSFFSIIGEFGLTLRQMSMASAPPHLIGLRKLLLDLYNKSGNGKEVGKIVYSDREKNTKSIKAPAVTLLGESTPERFYDALDETMISEGLLPRFLNIEYRGQRPKMNYNHSNVRPSPELVQKVATLCAQAATLNSRDSVINVQFTNEANEVLYEFDRFCDTQINSTDVEVRRHLWNRAHIKTLKLAALRAIGINPFDPVITVEDAEWAKKIVIRDCINIIQRFERGEIGYKMDERAQMSKMIECIIEFIKTPWAATPDTTRHVQKARLYHSEQVIPYNYIQRRLNGSRVFRDDRQGATVAIKRTIRTLIEMGDIDELAINIRKMKFGTAAAAYVVTNLDLFNDKKCDPIS